MARSENTEPVEVVDRLLYREAEQMLNRHAGQDRDGRCDWCSDPWPCPARRLAERAKVASYEPWPDSWTSRHDLTSVAGLSQRRLQQPGRRSNGGRFGYR